MSMNELDKLLQEYEEFVLEQIRELKEENDLIAIEDEEKKDGNLTK